MKKYIEFQQQIPAETAMIYLSPRSEKDIFQNDYKSWNLKFFAENGSKNEVDT